LKDGVYTFQIFDAVC